MGLLSDYLKIFTPAALAAGMALSPDEAEAMYVGPKAKGWDALTNKFSGLMDRMERAEISDKGANIDMRKFDPEQLKDFRSGKEIETTFGQIFNHPELYQNYPHLKGAKLFFDPAEQGARYVPPDATTKYADSVIAGDFRKDSLLHEIQHAIQQKEGWAKGGSPGAFNVEYARLKALPTLAEERALELLGVKQSHLENKILADEYSRGGNWEQRASEKIKKEIWDVLDSDKEYSAIVKEMESLRSKLGNKKPFDAYQNLAGEVESRDTAARMGMGLAERQSTLPYASQNVPLKDVITKFGMGGAALGPMLYSPEAAQARQYQNMAASQALQEPTFDPTTLLAGPARWGGGLLNMGLDTLMRYMTR